MCDQNPPPRWIPSLISPYPINYQTTTKNKIKIAYPMDRSIPGPYLQSYINLPRKSLHY